ncbi:MAG: hypothetical protein BWY87_01641 [Deltaproteobacteria bacterium ADurb.Bin510]|nr:MAG: hypothetical protein BWY87_01641 [Deltaproteobacteria bacterium ADurb.Bin510]
MDSGRLAYRGEVGHRRGQGQELRQPHTLRLPAGPAQDRADERHRGAGGCPHHAAEERQPVHRRRPRRPALDGEPSAQRREGAGRAGGQADGRRAGLPGWGTRGHRRQLPGRPHQPRGQVLGHPPIQPVRRRRPRAVGQGAGRSPQGQPGGLEGRWPHPGSRQAPGLPEAAGLHRPRQEGLGDSRELRIAALRLAA